MSVIKGLGKHKNEILMEKVIILSYCVTLHKVCIYFPTVFISFAKKFPTAHHLSLRMRNESSSVQPKENIIMRQVRWKSLPSLLFPSWRNFAFGILIFCAISYFKKEKEKKIRNAPA